MSIYGKTITYTLVLIVTIYIVLIVIVYILVLIKLVYTLVLTLKNLQLPHEWKYVIRQTTAVADNRDYNYL